MLQYVHDYRLPDQALNHLFSAQRLLALNFVFRASDYVDMARCSLEKYLAQENVLPDEKSKNGWVKMDDALQLKFSRYQLGLIHNLFCIYLKRFPDSLLASRNLEVVNICRELLGKPVFADVQECITSK